MLFSVAVLMRFLPNLLDFTGIVIDCMWWLTSYGSGLRTRVV
jgi:hypothetical protein